jgi:L-ribulokinase
MIRRETAKKLLPALDDAAEALPVDENGVVALDWLNGRRTPDADQKLKGAVTGITLGTDAPRIYKALAEATAFGSKAILERFELEGIPVRGITALGGVARKSRFVMQLMADVLEREVKVAVSDQACALGTAMLASVAAGIHQDTESAQKAMGSGIDKTYTPDPERSKIYTALYERYRKLGVFAEAEAGRAT